MNRPSFEQIYMNLALQLAERSTCERKKVGCVITSTDFRTVMAVGYNGNASGLSNGCDRPNEKGNCGCIHAEQNASINCDFPRDISKIVFVTYSPCPHCAKFFINLGNVKKVYYNQTYRDLTGLKFLKQSGIETEILTQAALY